MTEHLCQLCIRLMTNESLLWSLVLWEAGTDTTGHGTNPSLLDPRCFYLDPLLVPPWSGQGKRHILMLTELCASAASLPAAQQEGEIIASFSLGGNWLCLETFEHPIKLISFANEPDNTEHFKVKFRWAFHLAGLWGNELSCLC